MTQKVHIIRISNLNILSIDGLIEESLLQGFRFIKRLANEYQTGKNRFNKPGEALFVVLLQGETIAIGGLNQDTYFTPSDFTPSDFTPSDFTPAPFEVGDVKRVGRLRHVYVCSGWRGRGIGRMLVEHLIQEARPHYQRLTLRTDSPAADQFYQKLGALLSGQMRVHSERERDAPTPRNRAWESAL